MKDDVLYPRLELNNADADDRFLMESALRVDSSEPHRIAVDTALIVIDNFVGKPGQLEVKHKVESFYRAAFSDGRYACNVLARIDTPTIREQLETYGEFDLGQSVAGMIRVGPMSHPTREAVEAAKWLFDNDYAVEAIDLYRLGFDAGFDSTLKLLLAADGCRVEKRRASYRC